MSQSVPLLNHELLVDATLMAAAHRFLSDLVSVWVKHLGAPRRMKQTRPHGVSVDTNSDTVNQNCSPHASVSSPGSYVVACQALLGYICEFGTCLLVKVMPQRAGIVLNQMLKEGYAWLMSSHLSRHQNYENRVNFFIFIWMPFGFKQFLHDVAAHRIRNHLTKLPHLCPYASYLSVMFILHNPVPAENQTCKKLECITSSKSMLSPPFPFWLKTCFINIIYKCADMLSILLVVAKAHQFCLFCLHFFKRDSEIFKI